MGVCAGFEGDACSFNLKGREPANRSAGHSTCLLCSRERLKQAFLEPYQLKRLLETHALRGDIFLEHDIQERLDEVLGKPGWGLMSQAVFSSEQGQEFRSGGYVSRLGEHMDLQRLRRQGGFGNAMGTVSMPMLWVCGRLYSAGGSGIGVSRGASENARRYLQKLVDDGNPLGFRVMLQKPLTLQPWCGNDGPVCVALMTDAQCMNQKGYDTMDGLAEMGPLAAHSLGLLTTDQMNAWISTELESTGYWLYHAWQLRRILYVQYQQTAVWAKGMIILNSELGNEFRLPPSCVKASRNVTKLVETDTFKYGLDVTQSSESSCSAPCLPASLVALVAALELRAAAVSDQAERLKARQWLGNPGMGNDTAQVVST
ncbi:unnamed protein product [Polarella glacialis]|uniref:Uncharacterized protein n=1 Tax=Polarella glacialis TaxID=89957 RepID=A0A813JI34_POLGL|nr:unnamed protein product [Polarella glacialis]